MKSKYAPVFLLLDLGFTFDFLVYHQAKRQDVTPRSIVLNLNLVLRIDGGSKGKIESKLKIERGFSSSSSSSSYSEDMKATASYNITNILSGACFVWI